MLRAILHRVCRALSTLNFIGFVQKIDAVIALKQALNFEREMFLKIPSSKITKFKFYFEIVVYVKVNQITVHFLARNLFKL